MFTRFHFVRLWNKGNKLIYLYIQLVQVDERTSSANNRNGEENVKTHPIKHSEKMETYIAEQMGDLIQFIDEISYWRGYSYDI